MNVAELIAQLEDMDPEAEVRIAHQPSWPLEYGLGSVLEVDMSDTDELLEMREYAQTCSPEERAEAEERIAELEAASEESAPVVYLAEGSQLGYLPGIAAQALGWK